MFGSLSPLIGLGGGPIVFSLGRFQVNSRLLQQSTYVQHTYIHSAYIVWGDLDSIASVH
jgi:hypothetical protein